MNEKSGFQVSEQGPLYYEKCGKVFMDPFVKALVGAGVRSGEPIAGHRACIPSSVTQGRVVQVSVRWLEANPQNLDYVARSLVAAALSETFPCR